jgi:ligand-binding SRPBCC domain-containing protein
MQVYTLLRKQILNVEMEQAWEFFSSPRNLKRITPEYMQFRILHISGGEKMYAGQIIRYKLFALPFLPVTWTTEITHVETPLYFVDEQRSGPYSMWHHQHKFSLVPGGVEMIDEVNYALPLGFVGRIAHWLFVRRQLNAIFDYRYKVLEEMMSKKTLIMKSA